jgi:YidC/Oxa1 family membrane protein insertase
MDRKSIIIIVFCIVAIFLWSGVVVPKMYPPKPRPAGTNDIATGTVPGGTNVTETISAATNEASPVIAPSVIAEPDSPEELLVITTEEARFTFTSHGGGIKTIELLDYPQTVDCRAAKNGDADTNGLATLNDRARVPVLALMNTDGLQGDGVFTLRRLGDGVRAEKQLPNGLTLIKEFQPTTNYLFETVLRFVNATDDPVQLPAQAWSVGTATPLGPKDDGMSVGLLWFNGGKAETVKEGWFRNKFLGCFPGTPREIYEAGVSNVVWTDVHNQFFALVAMPETPASKVISRRIDLPPYTNVPPTTARKNKGPPQGFETAITFDSITVPPQSQFEKKIRFYGGPKKYSTLARLDTEYENSLDLVMEFGKFFGFFSKLLLLSMNGLHAVGLSYGLCIIAITIIIKLLFWPLTAASTRSMKRMAALQPQMKAIQEKHKDDPMKAQRKVMEFMKEHKVSPLGSCLPMLLQMPVFIGFFYMIRTAIELRGASFLWACDLSSTDTIAIIPGLGFIPFLGIPDVGFPINPLPLLMGVTMLWQSHMTPPSPGMDPMQQKLMRYMPLMFVVILYNYSAGLALYWTVNNLLSVLQTKLTKTSAEVPAGNAPVKPVAPAPHKKQKRK